MHSELNSVIALGQDITSHKYYSLASFTILFYDYLLTLEDEIKYAWTGKKSWVFWLFVTNRYFPMAYQIWETAITHSSRFSGIVCDKIAFYPILAFVICTLLAQVVLTLRLGITSVFQQFRFNSSGRHFRIHAVTMRNVLVTICFAIITASQLAVGVCLTTIAARKGAQTLPQIDLDAYQSCIFTRHRTLEIAYTSLSLVYDILAFSLTMHLARRSRVPGFKARTILEAIAEDAMWYFLVIFTSHFVFEMTLNLGRETIQLLPGAGILVYIPVMISRIMLSLRKAAGSPQKVWSLAQFSTCDTNPQGRSLCFSNFPDGREEVPRGVPSEP